MFDCFIDNGFNEKDAMQYRIVHEVAVILVDIKSSYHTKEYENFIMSRNFPPNVIQGFLQAQTSIEMETSLKGMIQIIKQKWKYNFY